jgi:hypothetical protein
MEIHSVLKESVEETATLLVSVNAQERFSQPLMIHTFIDLS